jgi:hypothetical protein
MNNDEYFSFYQACCFRAASTVCYKTEYFHLHLRYCAAKCLLVRRDEFDMGSLVYILCDGLFVLLFSIFFFFRYYFL